MIDIITEIWTRSLIANPSGFSYSYNWDDFHFSFSCNGYGNRVSIGRIKINPAITHTVMNELSSVHVQMKGDKNFSREQFCEFMRIITEEKEDVEETVTIDILKSWLPPSYNIHSVSRILPNLNSFNNEHVYINFLDVCWHECQIETIDKSFYMKIEWNKTQASLSQLRKFIALGTAQ